jgi:hypothetical protein
MVQEQTSRSEQPQEEEQAKSRVGMEFAIPSRESRPESRDIRRLGVTQGFSG